MSRKPSNASRVDEQKVEQDLANFEKLFLAAWQRDPANVEALVERLRVEQIVSKFPRPKKILYRAAIDYLEDVLEQRYEKSEHDREKVRKSVISYIKSFMQGIET